MKRLIPGLKAHTGLVYKLLNEHHLTSGIITVNFNFPGNVDPQLLVGEVQPRQAASRVKKLNYEIIDPTLIFVKEICLFLNCDCC